ncbi:MAG: hypothetical protein WD851_01940 [Pirellulales bacterium]
MLRSRPLIRRVTVLLSLALYGSVTLVGQGLHLLMPHSAVCFESASAAPCSCGHHARSCCDTPTTESEAAGVSRSQSGHDCNNCPICDFLAQARAASWTIATSDSSPQLTSRVSIYRAPAFSSSETLVHVPRGPPATAI